IVRALLKWFSENARDLPWRRTRDPYSIWISEIMLQQTQVKTVIPYWEHWLREIPTIKDLAKAKPEKVLKLWEGLGYYSRARNLQNAAQIILAKHVGEFPETFAEILALPGIGRYTAGAICSIAFNQSKPILDGNVIRVLTRVFGISGNPREKTTNTQLWSLADQLVSIAKLKTQNSKPSCSFLNQSLMELGALICTPHQPNCPGCPLQKICVAHRENRVDSLPYLAKRVKPTKRIFTAFIVQKNNRFLVQQRPAKIVNGGLWEFPNVEITDGKNVQEIQPFEIALRRNPLCTIKHSITRYRITLSAFRATLRRKQPLPAGKWLRIVELDKLAITSAHRKILNYLVKNDLVRS
ncbi:MAG: A/G-specific adenine glycosylase, partial [Verrucomicrobiota bacterium]